MKYIPTQNYLLIQPDDAEAKTKSGLFIPEAFQKKINEGKVTAVGPEVVGIQVGDRVVFTEHSEIPLKEDGEIFYVVAETNIILRKPAKIACAACDRGDYSLGHAVACPVAKMDVTPNYGDDAPILDGPSVFFNDDGAQSR